MPQSTTAGTDAGSDTQEVAKVIVIGISGPSSSGKSTLARLLLRLLNGEDEIEKTEANGATESKEKKEDRAFLVHQDDFFLNEDR
jgi:nicotinamide/nicotinate riboside kinase